MFVISSTQRSSRAGSKDLNGDMWISGHWVAEETDCRNDPHHSSPTHRQPVWIKDSLMLWAIQRPSHTTSIIDTEIKGRYTNTPLHSSIKTLLWHEKWQLLFSTIYDWFIIYKVKKVKAKMAQQTILTESEEKKNHCSTHKFNIAESPILVKCGCTILMVTSKS